MTDERLTEARKALARYEDRNSRPNPAHLADAVRGLIAMVDEKPATGDWRAAMFAFIGHGTAVIRDGRSVCVGCGASTTGADERNAHRWGKVIEAAGVVPEETEEAMTGEIRAVAFEDGTAWPCDLEDCECPEHDTPPRRPGTYLTIRLDGGFDGAGSWRVRIHRVPVKQEGEDGARVHG